MPTFPEAELRRLWATLETLLGPGGCPWDREQSSEDLARHLIEEGHEWLAACRADDAADQREELGDVAFLVLFGLQRLAEAGGAPGAPLAAADAKLRRRHPRVFPADAAGLDDPAAARDSAAQTRLWEAIKRTERLADGEGGWLKRLPASLGALAKSHRYQERAADVGFDWPDLEGVTAKLREELAELRRELDRLPRRPPPAADAGAGPSRRYRAALAGRDLAGLADELGDLFFVAANLCRWLGLDAEEVAEAANEKFRRRFGAMEAGLAAAGRSLEEADLEEMEGHWRAVKRRERGEEDA
jgi:ATP diphosphatase